MVSRRSFSREFKLASCHEILSGAKSKAQLCRELGLCPGVVDRWVDQFKALGADAFPNSGKPFQIQEANQIKELQAMIGRLMMENEFLKAALKKGVELREKKQG